MDVSLDRCTLTTRKHALNQNLAGLPVSQYAAAVERREKIRNPAQSVIEVTAAIW
jgi:hypothetical protein